MPLSNGSRLGAYEIRSPLGAGGMGEVYRAHDSKLNRDVALKILPESLAADPDRIARFRREAQLLAALNHPQIAHIYGVEDSTGVPALVMELVEGPTLADRIAQGAIPIDETLPIAKQIAEGLEAAHEQGIIHRDLKPANIKLRPDGTVKLLDFGLAKAFDPLAPVASGSASMSPTLSVHATLAGVILGTAAYMSPEQSRGRAVDRRADIWAFGCVLFEMLTGRRAFDGEDAVETIGAVVHKEPDWASLPASVSPTVRSVLRRCLEKDAKKRIRDIGDVQLALQGAFDVIQTAPSASASGSSSRAWIAATAFLLLAIVSLAGWILLRTKPVEPRLARFSVVPSAPGITNGSPFRDVAISPDGSTIAYATTTSPTTSDLWIRQADELASVQLKGLGNPVEPFFSPDGKWIGFFSGGELEKVSVTGGPPVSLYRNESAVGSAPRGATWTENGVIVFATTDRSTGLLSVPAGGGVATVLTTPEKTEADHLFSTALPGGNVVLFTIVPARAANTDESQIATLNLQTGERRILIRSAGRAEYFEPGFLVYAAAGGLRAVRFDATHLTVSSDPVPVVDRVQMKPGGAANFSASRTGTFVYVRGDDSPAADAVQRTLAWVDRQGKEQAINAPPRAYQRAALSPDGTRIALDIRDQEDDIWVFDLAHETLSRLTTTPAQDAYPVWTNDGRRIIYGSTRAGTLTSVFWQPSDGSGQAEQLTTVTDSLTPLAMTPDGRLIVFDATKGPFDLVRLDGSHTVDSLLRSTFVSRNASVSPDGRWFAYDSNETGEVQVYVCPFPNIGGGRWQVSKTGGTAPLWSPLGNELIYLDAENHLTSVAVQPSKGDAFSFAAPVTLVNTAYYTVTTRSYDMARDSRRFLMIKAPQRSVERPTVERNITVVLNWNEELKARLPVK